MHFAVLEFVSDEALGRITTSPESESDTVRVVRRLVFYACQDWGYCPFAASVSAYAQWSLSVI